MSSCWFSRNIYKDLYLIIKYMQFINNIPFSFLFVVLVDFLKLRRKLVYPCETFFYNKQRSSKSAAKRKNIMTLFKFIVKHNVSISIFIKVTDSLDVYFDTTMCSKYKYNVIIIMG